MTQDPVCVVMAVFRPDPAHLARQMESIAAQDLTPRGLVLVEADTLSGAAALEAARTAFAAAGREVELKLVSPTSPLDAPRAFAAGRGAALEMTRDWESPAPGPFIALSDQDDIWHADRLSAGVAELRRSGAGLVHSDARLVDGQGVETARSLFAVEGRQKRPSLRDLLYRNAVTGMTVTMTRDLVERALPVPDQSGVHFYHDLWLALMARATDGIALIDRPTVDYRQHGGNVMGAIDRRRGRRRPAALSEGGRETGPATGREIEEGHGPGPGRETAMRSGGDGEPPAGPVPTAASAPSTGALRLAPDGCPAM